MHIISPDPTLIILLTLLSSIYASLDGSVCATIPYIDFDKPIVRPHLAEAQHRCLGRQHPRRQVLPCAAFAAGRSTRGRR